MKYFYLTIFASIVALNAVGMQDANLTESQISTKKPPVSLHTVMNPDGVTREEWNAMFEEERSSIRENIKDLNKFSKLFNDYFKRCSSQDLEKHSVEYQTSFNEKLITDFNPITIITLNSIENVNNYIIATRRLENTRILLLATIPGLYNSDIGPLKTIFKNCTILLESFKASLTPIQFVHADTPHKKGIKGAGAKVIVIERILDSGHSFLKNTPQITIIKFTENYSYEDKGDGGHGAHVTGIVHQIAPEAEIFVSRGLPEFDQNLPSTTAIPKIINTSYAVKIPRLHLLAEKERAVLKKILKEYKEYTNDPDLANLTKLIANNVAFNNEDKCTDCITYITMFAKKPSLDQPEYANLDEPEYAKEIKAYEEDYAGTVLKKAVQASCQDANKRLQKDIELSKGKLRIQSFGNSYNDENWHYYSIPSLLINDEFLTQSILAININRENKLASSSNRPDHTLKEIIQCIMERNGIDDPTLINQQLLKVQASSLCALGTYVWSTSAHDRYKWCKGTSMSAPMVSGVAALIEGIYPNFSGKEIRECLLNSSSREFVIGTDEHELHVLDLPQDQVDLLNEKNFDLRKYIAFDPSHYGKGILCADAALQYAELKSANRSASVDELVTMLSEWKQNQK